MHRGSLATPLLILFLLLAALPSVAHAQGSIAGIVKDSTGAVLPGVTVEATSAALIEKVRSVVTDGTGQYQIVDLRPGTYTVTFTLPGFAAVRREGLELTGSFAATVNTELRVGSVAETVTVTGESALVDVKSAEQQRVLGSDVIASIPFGRTHFNAVVLVPGVTASFQDVGGSNELTLGGQMTASIHGGRAGDTRVMVDGVPTSNAETAGNSSNYLPNMGSTQEMTFDYAAGAAEQQYGGLRMNLLPREGGNVFSGSFFGTAVNSSFQGSNSTQELRDRGLRTPDAVKLNYDINPGFGGPIVRDTLWFYASARWTAANNYVGGLFYNLNAGNANAWTYAPDLSQRAYQDVSQRSLNGRFTWQMAAKHKLSVFYDDQGRCICNPPTPGGPFNGRVLPTFAPEASGRFEFPTDRLASATWSSPLTNHVLVEARIYHRPEHWVIVRPAEGDPALRLIPVTEQAGLIPGLTYRGGGLGIAMQPYGETHSSLLGTKASLSYVTGTHAFKIGYSNAPGSRESNLKDNDFALSYRFNNGVPNLITERATPFRHVAKIKADLGIFAQDKWTLSRLTLNTGIRFDYWNSYFPEQHLGPGPLVPTRNLTIPETPAVNWKDVTPRLGAAYDLFGNGKTAVKATLNKYAVSVGLQGLYGDNLNPVGRLANFVTRSWSDANRNFTPDCDLLNPAAQDTRASGGDSCGAMSDQNFGKATPTTTYDPRTISGWGVRPNNWEFSTGVQHELLPRVAINVGYFRRWYGNFTVTDNRAVAPSDYSPFSVTAPADTRLPDGGGYIVTDLYDLNPNKVGQVSNYFTLASDYGKQIEHWNGVDVNVNARPRGGMLLQGGLSTGRTSTDNCDIVAKLDNPSPLYCHVDTRFLTQVKLLGSYTIPRLDVQFSGTFQSLPGPAILALYAAPNALVAPSLGRALSGGAANVTVNLVEPGTMYGERLNQLDLRFAKILKSRRTRTSLNLDLYNALNANAVLTQNNNFASWQQPQTIVQARFVKISMHFDF